jgi:murein L,D-transpeptidase YafK
VLIEKAKRSLTLMSGTRQLAQYSVALGGEPVGAKNCQGDNKTPEGLYKIASRNVHSAYHRSLKISYPNEKDRKNAQGLECPPGGDIMIHGLPNGSGWVGSAHRLKDWTLGCIAVTDSEIEEIWRLVPDGTLVKIVP